MSRNANISSVGAGLGSLMLGLCLLPCLVGDARAAVAAWDQDRTTEIASGLPDAAQALYEAIYDQPAPPGPGRAMPWPPRGMSTTPHSPPPNGPRQPGSRPGAPRCS